MLKRFLTATGAFASLGAMALGGSAIASAQNSTTPAHHAVKVHHTTVEKTTGPDTDNVQSGDQTTPDSGTANASSTETGSENSSESGTPSDGPGGHQDPAGANIDHQFQGQE